MRDLTLTFAAERSNRHNFVKPGKCRRQQKGLKRKERVLKVCGLLCMNKERKKKERDAPDDEGRNKGR
jgi:hypothetical protein